VGAVVALCRRVLGVLLWPLRFVSRFVSRLVARPLSFVVRLLSRVPVVGRVVRLVSSVPRRVRRLLLALVWAALLCGVLFVFGWRPPFVPVSSGVAGVDLPDSGHLSVSVWRVDDELVNVHVVNDGETVVEGESVEVRASAWVPLSRLPWSLVTRTDGGSCLVDIDVVDVEAWANLAHKHGLPLIVDNTFATPYYVRPIEYGADIVVHSATKFIGGQGSTMGGIVVDGGKFDWSKGNKWPWLTEPNPSYHGVSFARDTAPAVLATYIRAIILRDEGAAISPFNAWLLLQGTETLPLRVERHGQNALKVAEYLNKHPKVEHVSHPTVSQDPLQKELYKKYFPNGGGSIFTFDIKGDAETTKKFIDHLELFSLLANVADVKSLVIHPASTTHSESSKEELLKQGIKENTVRFSIGIEDIGDILTDLEEAFKAI